MNSFFVAQEGCVVCTYLCVSSYWFIVLTVYNNPESHQVFPVDQ